MKAYCKCCKTTQPASFRAGACVSTGREYEDLCCDECHLIIATVNERNEPETTEEQRKAFRELTEPVIKWLNENYHPHCHVVITPTDALLSEGLIAYYTAEHVKG